MRARCGSAVAYCVLFAAIGWSVAADAQPCPGDLNGDQKVTIDELVRGVNAALSGCDGESVCPADLNNDGQVTIDELVRTVNTAVSGCDGTSSTPTPAGVTTATAPLATPTPTQLASRLFHYEFIPGSFNRSAAEFLAEANAQGSRGYAYRGDWLLGDAFDESGTLWVKDQSTAATFRYEFIPGAIQRSSAAFLAEVNAQGARGFEYRGDWLFGEALDQEGALYVKDESSAATFRYEFIPGPTERSSIAFLTEVNAQGARSFEYRGDWLFGDDLEESGALYVRNESVAGAFRYELIPGPLSRSAAAFLAEVNTQGARGFVYRGDWAFGEDLLEFGALYVLDASLPSPLRYEFIPGPLSRSAEAFLSEVNAQGSRGFAYRGDWVFGSNFEEGGALYVDRPHLGRGL